MDTKRIIFVVCIAALAALAVIQVDAVTNIFNLIGKASAPLITGAIIAYIANLIMPKLERIILPKSSWKLATSIRRPCAIAISYALLASVAALLVILVSTQMQSSLSTLAKGIESAWRSLSDFASSLHINDELASLSGNTLNLDAILNSAINKLSNTDSLVNSALGVGDSVARTLANLGIGFVFSLYLLMAKERVMAGARTLARTFLPELWNDRILQAAEIANESFSRFIGGQCMEAAILGSLCAIGMIILQLPHALTIGLCVGLTALIPLFGAWIGGVFGALMILPSSPEKALVFVVFLVILQSIENHFIYPRTMRHATGVSTIWVLASVIIGGAMGGIAGIMIAVPTVATAQRLLESYWKRDDESDTKRPCSQTEG